MNYATIYSWDFSVCFVVRNIHNFYDKVSEQIGMTDYWLDDNHEISLIKNNKAVCRIYPHFDDMYKGFSDQKEIALTEEEIENIIRMTLYPKDFEDMLNEE